MNTQVQTESNPFPAKQSEEGGIVSIEEQRAVSEIQAAMVIAKKFPRDQRESMDKILDACTRVTLADNALYSFPKGGSTVSGAGIRLVEVIAQCWGNMDCGIRELTQTPGTKVTAGSSMVQAHAWDLESNLKETKTFTVHHQLQLRNGQMKILTDPRDIYGEAANQGQRRKRACILQVIPNEVEEAAVRQINLTLTSSVGDIADAIEKLTAAFAEYKVTDEMLAQRLGHKLSATKPGEIVRLRAIYAALRDGMSTADRYFEMPAQSGDKQDEATAAVNAKLAEAADKKGKSTNEEGK